MIEHRKTDAQLVPASRPAFPWRVSACALLVLVMFSSFGVIYTAHKSRELFRALEMSRQHENEIQIEWRQLLLERSTLSSHARVEAIANSELGMHAADNELRTVVIE